MPKSDQVPCFYTGQDDSWETPAQIVTRDEARQLKASSLGRFENHGQTFRLAKAIENVVTKLIDGPLGIGNLLPWAKVQNHKMAPERLHYAVPACADRDAHFGHCMSVKKTNEPMQPLFPLPVLAEAYS